ncbi:DUF2087 domain-containing protein [Cohnella candidum]|uniref:DUF2087 domain-containing protein n=1 Tax=Cohnella candidum TaxID=2674991 RepID=A0A3G3K1I6_9BACL|nr:DUF2087 domain-containing protein [Cohnella candidum]AYQ74323.1 DUF2087 domain-containing protein [Cohnella candidum]
MQVTELFWEVPLNELKQGFTFDAESESFTCLACGEKFIQGVIYPFEGGLYEAGKFARIHVEEAHGSMFEFLLGLDKKLTGLTDLQKNLLQMFHSGMSDNEIVKESGGGSTSTIRNHRFALRERMKQAKVFLAIMELADTRVNRQNRFIPIHRTATMVDQRYEITEKENAEILKNYFKQGPDGPLSEFPKKEKRKIVILRHLARMFEENRRYTEKEVNALLKERFADFATLRRYLIEYGYMDRLADGSQYWLKK